MSVPDVPDKLGSGPGLDGDAVDRELGFVLLFQLDDELVLLGVVPVHPEVDPLGGDGHGDGDLALALDIIAIGIDDSDLKTNENETTNR